MVLIHNDKMDGVGRMERRPSSPIGIPGGKVFINIFVIYETHIIETLLVLYS